MKRAQITLYIIIGISILLLIGSAIYITQKVYRPAVKLRPVDQPIQLYVESCIQQTAIDALVQIGANGGYLTLKDPFVTKRILESSLAPAEGDLLLVSRMTRQALPYWYYMSTPNDCKQCQMDSIQPSLDDIKKQVDDYINVHLDECINLFDPFLEQGYLFQTGKPVADTIFAEEDVRIGVDYPVTVKLLDATTKVNRFETGLDLQFKKIYELADAIKKQEIEKSFLESTVFHLISLHTGLSISKLPPISEVNHEKTLSFWFKPLVMLNLQQLLLSYIPLLQVDKTLSAKQITVGDNDFEQGFYKGMFLKFLEEEYPFKVNFLYLDWPFYFDITPREGSLLTGETHIQEFPFGAAPAFQTNYYEFYYDISAPVLVEIRDKNAMKGKGYSFSFALELNIRDNKNPVEWNLGRGTIGVWDPDNMDLRHISTDTTGGVCSLDAGKWICSLTTKQYNTEQECVQACFRTVTVSKAYVPEKTLFGDKDQRVSDAIIINVLDAVTLDPLPEASVLYKCGYYDNIIVGSTGHRGKIKTTLPMCINGQLSVEKEGYAKKIIALTINPDDRKELQILLEPEAVVSASVKKMPVKIINLRDADYKIEPEAKYSYSWSGFDAWDAVQMQVDPTFLGQITSVDVSWEESGHLVGKSQKPMKLYDRFCCDIPEPLEPNNKAVLIIERVPETPLDPEYQQMIILEQNTEDKITLIPGLYKVNGMLMDNDGFEITAGCQEICTKYDTSEWAMFKQSNKDLASKFLPLSKKPECKSWLLLPEEPVKVKPALNGGVFLDNSTGYWNITRDDLRNSRVEFYFVQTLTPTCTMMSDCVLDVCVDIAEMQSTEGYSQQYRSYLEPKFFR